MFSRFLAKRSFFRHVASDAQKAKFPFKKCLSVVLNKQVTCHTDVIQTRHSSSFFTHLSADEIWSGVSAVSRAGKKRGRGKRGDVRKRVDLNKGQFIGEGKSNMVWPGLNSHIIKGRELVQQQKLPENPDREADLIMLREKGHSRGKREKLSPLDRGWSGRRLPGQTVGSPDPIGDYKFTGFDTRVLEYKLVTNMTGNQGRKQRFSCFVVTGNRNGLGGFGLAKAPNGKAAVRKAKNTAAQKMQYFELCDGHTVWHNFYEKEEQTAVFVKKKEKGYGLVCHRAIKTICEVIGIKDLHAKAEGSTKNVQRLTKAFFNGLRKMETHQQLADRLGLNVVELRKEMDNYPIVVAQPEKCRTEVSAEEDLEFNRLYYGGKVEYVRPKSKPFFENFHAHRKKVNLTLRFRNQYWAKIQRQALME